MLLNPRSAHGTLRHMTSEDALHLAAMIDSIPVGLILFDTQGRVTYVNSRAARWDQTPTRTLVGHTLQEGSPGWMSAGSAAVLRQAVTDRIPVQMRERAPHLGLLLDTRLAPSVDGLVAWVSEIDPSDTEVGKTVPASGSGIHVPQHDLMQPLGAINNYAELIRCQSTDAVQRYAGEIERIATAMAAKIRRGSDHPPVPGVANASGPAPVRDDQ
ncbi:MAG: PAS domain-containing protein [Candidatus Eisenbacteria bacterium]